MVDNQSPRDDFTSLKVGEFIPRRMVPGDRLFTPIYDFMVILSAIGHAVSLLADGPTHKSARPVMRISTRWPDYSLAVPLRGPLESILAGNTPMFIDIGIMTNPENNALEIPNFRIRTDRLHPIAAHLVPPIFLMFFERYNDWLNATYGRGSTEQWHPTLNFARVIRNAAAHGSITFRNPASPPVQWRGLSFSPADNGKRVIGDTIQLGEMLALMFDADDALTSIGAPIL